MAEKLIGGIRINDNSNFDVYADGTKPTGLINNVTGESIEGGGSGDFTTAEVTISEYSAENIKFVGLITAAEPFNREIITYITAYYDDPGSYNLVLYKGEQLIPYPSDIQISILNGDAETIEIDGDTNILRITGNCTIAVGLSPE